MSRAMGLAIDLPRGREQRRAVSTRPEGPGAWTTGREAASSEPSSEDLALVAAARGGDRGAFEEIYRRYARMVHGIILSRVPRDAADDLVQEVFILVLRRIPGLRDDASFGGWLAAIARNQAHDFHRRAVETAELPENLAGGETADGEAEWILEIIRGLPEAYRETLILRLVEGMTGPEIAERTGLTPGSVRVNLHRGMKQLREQLAGRIHHE
jgi:RNA polymerase sigma-70 factor (ECF subfamily)